MTKVILKHRKDGKASLALGEHGGLRIRVLNQAAEPYAAGSQRARVWNVVSLMNGITVAQAHQILELLEPNIQGRIGRPLGWVVDAIDRGYVEVYES